MLVSRQRWWAVDCITIGTRLNRDPLRGLPKFVHVIGDRRRNTSRSAIVLVSRQRWWASECITTCTRSDRDSIPELEDFLLYARGICLAWVLHAIEAVLNGTSEVPNIRFLL